MGEEGRLIESDGQLRKSCELQRPMGVPALCAWVVRHQGSAFCEGAGEGGQSECEKGLIQTGEVRKLRSVSVLRPYRQQGSYGPWVR